MRLKLLILLGAALAVRISAYADYTCQHDGYSVPDGKCQCRNDYGGNDCSKIQCENSGVLAPYEVELGESQRCNCPPGFLGLHCEPVQCVPGDIGSFDEAEHARDVSIIITYNKEFQDQFKLKDKSDVPLPKTICDAVYGQAGVKQDSKVHFWVMQNDIITSKGACQEDFAWAIESCTAIEDEQENVIGRNCEGDLDTKYILGALNEMGEDSRMIILSNNGIKHWNETSGIDDIEEIRKKAISLRIQIHSLVLSPRTPQDNIIYFSDDFAALRDLSESTMGFFINPFDASGGQKLSENGATDILNSMMTIFFEYVVVDRITTSSTSCKEPTDYTVFRAMENAPAENEIWLTVISAKPAFNAYTTSWLGAPEPLPTQRVFAGYFNAYSVNATKGRVISVKPYSTQGGKCVPSTVLVLAKSSHLARFAITSDDNKDATSPYAISGGDNTLVGHFREHYHEERLKALYLEFSNKDFNVTLDAEPTQRDCQYNARFGKVECEDGADTFIRVRDRDSGAAVTVQNLYCSPKDKAMASTAHFLARLEADAPATECTPAAFEVKSSGRAMIVAAHATQTIYQLFNGNKNSAIGWLNKLAEKTDPNDEEKDYYTQFILNIYNKDQGNAKVTDNYAAFKDDMMTQWHDYSVYLDDGYTTPDPEESYFDKECSEEQADAVIPLLNIVWQTEAHENSDVIFIFDRKINITDEDLGIVRKYTYIRRLRLIVLLLGCNTAGGDFVDSTNLKIWNELAASSGGFAVHFKQPEDLNKFLENYVDLVDGQTAAAMDNKDTDYNFSLDPVISTPFRVRSGETYKILVNTLPIAKEASLSNGAQLLSPTVLGNTLAVFDYEATTDETLTVTVTPLPYFYYSSIRVLDMAGDLATIGFTESACLDKPYPDFNPQAAQIPMVVAEKAATVKLTLFNSIGAALKSDDARDDTYEGSYAMDYNWKCNNNNDLFYISADVANNFTRLITTRCLGGSDSDHKACINGEPVIPEGKTMADEICVCPHQYEGEFCERPVCQNGGNVTAALECACVQPDYEGQFCEIYKGCADEPNFVPDFKSIAETVVFLVERSANVLEKIKKIDNGTLNDVRTAQYIIVQYGNSSDSQVLVSTTDRTNLVKTLKSIVKIEFEEENSDSSSTVAPSSYFDPVPAIRLALEAKVTGSAQVFWFAEYDNADLFVEEVFDSLAHHRVSVSALFSKQLHEGPMHPVQMAGGTVFYSDQDDYKNFFIEYVAVLLQFQSTFEFRPSLLSTSITCNGVHVVNIDQTTQKLFVAASGETTTATLDIKSTTNLDGQPTRIAGGFVFTFAYSKKKYLGAGRVTVTIGQQVEALGRCSSIVIAFNQIQVGYGFVQNEDSESKEVQIKTGLGDHLLVTYWTAQRKTYEDIPTARLISFPPDVNGTLPSTEVYMTVRGNCAYSLSVPIHCEHDIYAYGVIVSNWVKPDGGSDGDAVLVDQYIPVICPSGSCVRGQMNEDGDCECEPLYGGDYCEVPKCKNGEAKDTACICYTGYSGDYCEEYTAPENRGGVAFLFIQDVCGADEALKDQAQSVLPNYYALLDPTNKFYLGTNDAANSDLVAVQSAKALNDALAANRAKPGSCSPALSAAIDKFYAELHQPTISPPSASEPTIGRANIAHVTTVGTTKDQGTNMSKLKSDFVLNMDVVGVTAKNVNFPSKTDFNDFPGDFEETYDMEVALLDLVNSLGSFTKPKLPAADYPRCIKNLQAAIAFHTDLSSVDKLAEYRAKTQKIIASVTKYFDQPTVKSIDVDDDDCSMKDLNQIKDKTRFTGTIYVDKAEVGTETFCTSNIATYPNTIGSADYHQGAQVNLSSVINSYTKFYKKEINMKCQCLDFDNDNTTKIILWTPLSPTSLDPEGSVSFDSFGPSNFQHIVMPFGFNYRDSPLWRKLVPDSDNWLTDASVENYEVEDIIQDIWTRICRLAGTIEQDQTAEPFNAYTTRKPKTGDKQLDSQTDAPTIPSGDGN